MLVGSKDSKPGIESNILEIGLLNIASGKTFPQHARDAKEICYILSGSPLLGATEQHVEKVDAGDLIFYDNAAPRAFMVRAENIILYHKNYEILWFIPVQIYAYCRSQPILSRY